MVDRGIINCFLEPDKRALAGPIASALELVESLLLSSRTVWVDDMTPGDVAEGGLFRATLVQDGMVRKFVGDEKLEPKGLGVKEPHDSSVKL